MLHPRCQLLDLAIQTSHHRSRLINHRTAPTKMHCDTLPLTGLPIVDMRHRDHRGGRGGDRYLLKWHTSQNFENKRISEREESLLVVSTEHCLQRLLQVQEELNSPVVSARMYLIALLLKSREWMYLRLHEIAQGLCNYKALVFLNHWNRLPCIQTPVGRRLKQHGEQQEGLRRVNDRFMLQQLLIIVFTCLGAMMDKLELMISIAFRLLKNVGALYLHRRLQEFRRLQGIVMLQWFKATHFIFSGASMEHLV
mmetsp:Transcript_29676/g.45516  ORF Transcript_29676/g.45516 Transcript_29676/m.45516 type:complete len:253 (+) Transcript_29676:262-1020(+)